MHRTEEVQEKIVFIWELRSYFGLSYEQIAEIEQQWNFLYEQTLQRVEQ